MIRWLALTPFLNIPSAAQTLIDLAPSSDSSGPLPLTWTAEARVGYETDAFSSALNNGNFYFFGDSLIDTGNVARELGGELGPGYPGQSFTNGETWPKYLIPDVNIAPTTLPAAPRSYDFAYAISTTTIVKGFQVDQLFADFAASTEITPRDIAVLSAGSNDFLDAFDQENPPTMAALTQVADDGVANLIDSASTLVNTYGFENLIAINVGDVTKAPSISGFDAQGEAITGYFNSRLLEGLRPLASQANLLWIDSADFFNRAITNPSSFGFTNVTNSAAPDALSGIPSTLPPEEINNYLFYDHVHPTTAFHQQFAAFVGSHLSLGNDAAAVNLITDAALGLDDYSGFEHSDLSQEGHRWNFSFENYETKSGPHRRSTQFAKAEYAYAFPGNFLLGGEVIFTNGDSRDSNLKTFGIGVDALLRGSVSSVNWEVGMGIGTVSGDLERDYSLGNLSADSDQSANFLSLHGGLQQTLETPIGMAYWEFGLKQRYVHRDSTSESGASSLDLHYRSETLSSTIANIEAGIRLAPELWLELAYQPVLHHSGGEIQARQKNGLATFETADFSGYDIDTGRITLRGRINENTTAQANFLFGSDDTWSTGLGVTLSF